MRMKFVMIILLQRGHWKIGKMNERTYVRVIKIEKMKIYC